MAIEQMTNGQLVDTVQKAVIGQAENAAAVIDKAITEVGHAGPFYHNPEFWVAVAFVLVIALLLRPVGRLAGKLLVKRIEAIADRINEARKLKDDAHKLWVEYEKKYLGASSEAMEIMKRAEREIEFIKKEKISKLENEIKIKEGEAKNRIAAAEEEALSEIRKLSSELSVKAVKKVLQEKMDNKVQDDLINQSIDLLTKIK